MKREFTFAEQFYEVSDAVDALQVERHDLYVCAR